MSFCLLGRLKVFTLAILLAVSYPLQVGAHHSFATHYDVTRAIELVGTVADFSLRSPHSEMLLNVVAEDGQTVQWQIEAAASAHLQRMGIRQNTFTAGDTIKVVALPNRHAGNPLVFGNGFVAADGESYGRAPDLTVEASPQSELIGIESMAGRWQVPYPKRLSEAPMSLSAAGQLAWDNYDPQLSPANTCETSSIPGILYAPFLVDIQMTNEQLVFRFEHYALVRTVPLNGETAAGDPDGVFGLVKGYKEANEMVVESSAYKASRWGLALAAQVGADVPSSMEKKIIESYSIADGGNTLNINFRVEDPVYLTLPYEQLVVLKRVADDEPIFEFECELDSAERFSRDP